ncbi:hypothetical protein U2261_02675 [Achromobacter xylosoxidans]|jgi:hypothetical protein|uniref:Uncharacterized protein n=1 Tax=Alcaligenes xylosoxydans xylosoxydans TaxID=85698 RepID=A0A0D6IHA4_ALCXX|nr:MULTISPECIES: hypothetical protein [Achromobacter]AHC49382.1 hypothetical protein AX27061_4926 [Achromobacter xylosoxidans NBRC 15126 = ATCC 27061]AMH04881.1 hypothetical protein AL509_07080 [Achromobacter xylosoxidans]KMJ88186.1 hypothetical protein ACH58_24820 [Achromobacter xylosoxidans]KOQ23323.1 hypothetical protein ABW36_24650 [Achromobacter xylosoxidans]KOQ23816.1 hypothetical protein ABW35_16910 [Achromobacter xylosoxidans]
MIAMLSFTIPAAGILALRNALGEERAIAVAQALEHARLQGEADLLKRSQDEARAELQAYALSRVDFARERAELERDIAKRAAQEQFDRLVEIVAQLPTREELKQLPTREELKRFATHEDLAEVRHDLLRLDKKMTVGFLTLLTLQLASSAPTLIDWGIKMVGYALR